MKLYYSPGACSLAPHIALREAERTFELERIDLRSKKTSTGADYLQINPKGYVPALQLDGPDSDILTEAPVILQYIADLVPERGLAPPNGTFGRYYLQEWLNFLSSEVHKMFGPLFAPDTPVPTQERSRSKISERLAYTAKRLDGKPFLTGDTFTVADAYLFAMLRWCERFEIELDDRFTDYFHRVSERPAVQAALLAEGLLETKRHRRSA
jgi:glutathione S-transferase